MFFDLAETHGKFPRGAAGIFEETLAFFEGWLWLREEQCEWRQQRLEMEI